MQDKYLTIEALTKYLKYKFDNDDNLRSVYIKGEISNFKAHSTGHFYFSLKDEKSKINAIMFSTASKNIMFRPTEGMKVLVHGRIGVYESTGNYQIYVDEMLEDGVGNLYIAFEQLKQKLEAEGLFDVTRKKDIPKYPKKIGIVTARTGAAIRDITTTIQRRYPICEIYLFPSLVQGENAYLDIVKKIKQANNYDLDTLIVGRGGGSIEDLWPFNEEAVARAIYESKIPVISAVGHEVDFTIADFVADLRAPTPTAAAELAVPSIVDTLKYLDSLKSRINEAIMKQVNYQKLYLDSIKNSFVIKNPMIMYDNKRQKLDQLNEKLNNILNFMVEKRRDKLNNIKNNNVIKNPKVLYKSSREKLDNVISTLELLNPVSILKRGYSITYKEDAIISSIDNIKKDEVIKTRVTNGFINSKVIEVIENE